jgi:hypothetical protein
MQNPPSLNDLLASAAFDGLAITKTPTGTFAVSILSGCNWSEHATRGTVCEALAAALAPTLPPCPVALPACPVPLPA